MNVAHPSLETLIGMLVTWNDASRETYPYVGQGNTVAAVVDSTVYVPLNDTMAIGDGHVRLNVIGYAMTSLVKVIHGDPVIFAMVGSDCPLEGKVGVFWLAGMAIPIFSYPVTWKGMVNVSCLVSPLRMTVWIAIFAVWDRVLSSRNLFARPC